MGDIVRNHTHSTVKATDPPGPGGANHEYRIDNFMPEIEPGEPGYACMTQYLQFQKGPMQENLPNGLHNEDLLYIVKHRLESFQDGPFACQENQVALDNVMWAIDALERRTADRRKRGVEGKSIL